MLGSVGWTGTTFQRVPKEPKLLWLWRVGVLAPSRGHNNELVVLPVFCWVAVGAKSTLFTKAIKSLSVSGEIKNRLQLMIERLIHNFSYNNSKKQHIQTKFKLRTN